MSAWTDPRRYARRRKVQRQGTGTVRARTAPYTADHVLWHAPRDSYEKQVTLYLEEMRAEYAKASSMRAEYAKASSRIDIFSNPKLQFSDRYNSLYGYSDFLARL